MSTRTTRLDTATPSTFRQNIAVPTYNRRDLLPHTVHIGVGGFHRAHQAVYLDDLLALPDTPRWGEIGVGILPSDDRMRDAMLGQDCLYTLVERSAEQQNARVIGSMTQYLYAPAQREAVLEALASPVTRIVTLTITEGGYFLDEGTGKFNANHPALQHDLANLGAPTSSLGILAEALDRRRLRNLPAFTLQSCDNLQGNGHITRDVLLGYAALRKPELHDWIAAHVAFPNSMVDRITPATTSADIQWLADRFGIADAWPVVTEPFRQWVIEDTFSNDRPEWERVGAQIVDDVAPYETMKIRLLNGSHEAIAFLGALAGYTFVHEVMQDPLFHRFIEAFMEEVTQAHPASTLPQPHYQRSGDAPLLGRVRKDSQMGPALHHRAARTRPQYRSAQPAYRRLDLLPPTRRRRARPGPPHRRCACRRTPPRRTTRRPGPAPFPPSQLHLWRQAPHRCHIRRQSRIRPPNSRPTRHTRGPSPRPRRHTFSEQRQFVVSHSQPPAVPLRVPRQIRHSCKAVIWE